MNYEPIIGLEVHVELATKSKMFCGCPADHFGREPNTVTCPVCLGLPGALPVPNKKAIDWTIMLGLALDCQIAHESKFDRKNYFYPDLPKGYQISQYDKPIAIDGSFKIQTSTFKIQLNENTLRSNTKIIRIRRVHIEEDTGKLQHALVDGKRVTLVDFNRSGVPLAEIVTEPDFRSIEEVDVYLKELQKIIKHLGISQAEMEKGTMRIEPSISLRPETGDKKQEALPLYRVGLKNINSFRFARKALEYEIKRQTALLEKGETPTQQTRGWSEDKNATVLQREKEEAHDYRYFPEPDIPPTVFDSVYRETIQKQIPASREEKKNALMRDFTIDEKQAIALLNAGKVAHFVAIRKEIIALDYPNISGATIANYVINKIFNIRGITPLDEAKKIIQSQTSVVIANTQFASVIDEVLKTNNQAVADYKAGKDQALMFLLGQVKKRLPTAAAPNIIEALKKALQPSE